MTFICECCNYATQIKGNLAKHLKSHKHNRKMAETPVEPLQVEVVPVELEIEPETAIHACKFCFKRFTSTQSMYRHMRTTCRFKNAPVDTFLRILRDQYDEGIKSMNRNKDELAYIEKKIKADMDHMNKINTLFEIYSV